MLPDGDIAIARLVDLSAELAGVSIEYDASLLRGNATLRLAEGLEGDELWSLTNELLAARGLTTIRRGTGSPLLSVVKLPDAARLAGEGWLAASAASDPWRARTTRTDCL